MDKKTTDETLCLIHNKICDILQQFHEFCNENGLTYYMLGGTQLGAVRHKGFIPWDDDADVGMPREDYNKFKQLSKKMTNLKFIETSGDDKAFRYQFGKLQDFNTTVKETICNGDIIVGGVYIDIFPLDCIGASFDEAVKVESKILKTWSWYLSKVLNVYSTNRFKRVIKKMLVSVLPNDYIYKKTSKLIEKNSNPNNKYLANIFGAWAIKEIIPKEVFGKPTLYDFENIKLYGVEDYNSYLTSLYGDYMQLPPKEKRHTHGFVYVNLNLPYEEYLKENNQK